MSRADVEDAGDEADRTPASARRGGWMQLAKIVFGVAVMVFAVIFVASRWTQLRAALDQASWGWVVLAVGFGALGQFGGALAFRSVLAGVAKPLPVRDTNRVFFVSQLGKYIPGSVWPILALTEMGRRYGIARRAAATGGILALIFSLALGGLVGIVLVLVSVSSGTAGLWWLVLLIPLGVALVHPAVVEPAVNRVLRLVRREPISLQLRGRTLYSAVGWQVAGWILLGLQCWALVVALGGPVGSSVVPSIGGFALAYVAGTLFIPAPAGAGVREAVLTVALGGIISGANHFTHDKVVVVVLLSRIVLAFLDFALAGLAALMLRLRSTGPTTVTE